MSVEESEPIIGGGEEAEFVIDLGSEGGEGGEILDESLGSEGGEVTAPLEGTEGGEMPTPRPTVRERLRAGRAAVGGVVGAGAGRVRAGGRGAAAVASTTGRAVGRGGIAIARKFPGPVSGIGAALGTYYGIDYLADALNYITEHVNLLNFGINFTPLEWGLLKLLSTYGVGSVTASVVGEKLKGEEQKMVEERIAAMKKKNDPEKIGHIVNRATAEDELQTLMLTEDEITRILNAPTCPRPDGRYLVSTIATRAEAGMNASVASKAAGFARATDKAIIGFTKNRVLNLFQKLAFWGYLGTRVLPIPGSAEIPLVGGREGMSLYNMASEGAVKATRLASDETADALEWLLVNERYQGEAEESPGKDRIAIITQFQENLGTISTKKDMEAEIGRLKKGLNMSEADINDLLNRAIGEKNLSSAIQSEMKNKRLSQSDADVYRMIMRQILFLLREDASSITIQNP
jgi:hypothetical protein